MTRPTPVAQAAPSWRGRAAVLWVVIGAMVASLLLARAELTLANDVSRPVASAAKREERISYLIGQLGAAQFWKRRRAQQQLKALGFEAFDALTVAEEDGSLEVSTAARFLLSTMEIDWTREHDAAVVKNLLAGYEELDLSQRQERIRSLSRQLDGAGVEALCRLARYEKNLLASKYAASALLDERMLLEHNWPKHRQTILAGLGTSERNSVHWLRAFARYKSDPPGAAVALGELVDAEEKTLRLTPDNSRADFVRVLLEVLLDQARQSDDTATEKRAASKLALREPGGLDTLAERIVWLAERELWDALEQVVKRFDKVIQSNPPTLYALAAARFAAGKVEEAEKLASRAFAVSPDRVTEHREVAQRLRTLGRIDWAVREFEHVIKMPPYAADAVNSQFWLSGMLHDAGRNGQAADVLAKAVPKMAELVKKSGDSRDLTRLLNELKGLMHFYRALDYQQQDKKAEYLADLRKALALDPTNADILIGLYRLPDQTDDEKAETVKLIRQAADHFRGEIREQPREATAYNQYAWLVANTEGDYEEALRFSRRSLELSPRSAGYLDTLARCCFASGDLPSAVRYQTLAVRLEPHSGMMTKQLKQFRQELEQAQE